MAARAQRTWYRIEAPQTYRGHALRASFGAQAWTAWENRDGSWSLQYGDGDPTWVPDYPEARKLAETLRTRAPSNQAAPVQRNPFQNAAFQSRSICQAIPAGWLTSPCWTDPSGTTHVTVRRGFGTPTRQRLAAMPFAVTVEEGP